MKEHVHKVFDYDHWATLRVVEALGNTPSAPDRALELLDHLITTKVYILEVIRFGDRAEPPERPVRSLVESSREEQRSHDEWMNYLPVVSDRDLNHELHLAGERGHLDCSVTDLCHHAVNHATHHRAQIGMILRSLGVEPPGLDYTSFCWTEPTNG